MMIDPFRQTSHHVALSIHYKFTVRLPVDKLVGSEKLQEMKIACFYVVFLVSQLTDFKSSGNPK